MSSMVIGICQKLFSDHYLCQKALNTFNQKGTV